MYQENAERKDDCPYVQGQILRRAMLSGACSCQEELACAFSLSHSKVSRLIMIAQLPSVIVAAFASPCDIRESWGVQLYQIWKDRDPEYRVAARARGLANRQPRPPAREVYDILLTASGGKPAKTRLDRRIPIRGKSGSILFREQDQIASILFTVPKTILSPARRATLRRLMIRILDTPHVNATSDHQVPTSSTSAANSQFSS
jgi:hypothetical protein